MSRFKGGRVGSVKKLQKAMDSSDSNRAFIQYIGQDEEVLVHFLTEPDEWYRYYEHYDPVLKFFPCTGDECVGCDSEVEKTARASQRYLANVLLVDDNRVVPMKLARDLANRVLNKYERYGTLLERDFYLSRTGTGRDTAYDVDAEAPTDLDIDQYELVDLEKALEDLLDYALGDILDDDEDDDEDERPIGGTVTAKKAKTKSKKSKRSTKRRPAPEADDSDVDDDDLDDTVDEDDDEPEFECDYCDTTSTTKSGITRHQNACEHNPDNMDEDEDDEEEEKPRRSRSKKARPEPEEDEEDIVLEEEDLYDMSLTELKDLASQVGLEVPPKARKSTVIDIILDAAEEA